MNNTNVSQGKKWKSPIRWGGFLTLLILTSVVVLYFWLFFDLHLRRGLEAGWGAVNGAEVNIGSLSTRLFRGELALEKIEFGNAENPMQNRFEIDRVRFSLRLAPLIKKQVVIEESSVLGIKFATARRFPARIPAKRGGVSELSRQVMKGFDDVLKKKIGEGEVEKLGSLFSGGNFDTKALELGADSHSFQQIRKTEAALSASAEAVETQLKSLPDDKAVGTVKTKIEQLTQKHPKNVDEAVQMIGLVNALSSEVETLTARAKTAAEATAKLAGELDQSVRAVETAMDQDVDYLKKKLKLPNFDFKDLTLPLLGPKLGRQLEQALYYVDLVRRYMPAKKKGQVEPVVVQERRKGRDFQFGKVANYPSFVLEKAIVTSMLSEDPTQGDARGEILGVNTNPSLYGRPSTAALTAHFPTAKVRGARLNLLVDHVTEISKEKGSFQVESFPVEEWVISEGKPFLLKVQKALGRGTSELTFEDDAIRLDLNVVLSGAIYEVNAEEEKFTEILKRSLQSFPTMNVRAKVVGRAGDLDVSLTSDLGQRLGSAIQNEIQGQVDALNSQVRKKVNDAVEEKRKAMELKLSHFKANTLSPLQSKLQGITGLSGELNQQLERLNKEKDQLLRGKAQEEIEKVKKSIKLPGF